MYKKENDSKVKERLSHLVIRIREDGQIPFRVVEMHRSNPWTSDWLKRYDNKSIEGLMDRTKACGRPSEISEETSYQIKKELKENSQGGLQNRWEN